MFFLPVFSIFVRSRNPLSPLSANVSICLTPPPPFVIQCQHFPNPPLAADIICEQPLSSNQCFNISSSNILNNKKKLRLRKSRTFFLSAYFIRKKLQHMWIQPVICFPHCLTKVGLPSKDVASLINI